MTTKKTSGAGTTENGPLQISVETRTSGERTARRGHSGWLCMPTSGTLSHEALRQKSKHVGLRLLVLAKLVLAKLRE